MMRKAEVAPQYHENFITMESMTASDNAYPLITQGGYLYGFPSLELASSLRIKLKAFKLAFR
jgi:hypothetical protein